MVNLSEQIAAAEAAAARVAELEQVKATADQLPALKRQLAAQQWVAQAEPAAEAAEQQARRVLAEVTPKMMAWRQRLEALYAELHEHVAALPGIQSEISVAAKYARTAAGYRQAINHQVMLADFLFAFWNRLAVADPVPAQAILTCVDGGTTATKRVNHNVKRLSV